MKKILISACLLGDNVRYDGGGFELNEPILKDWLRNDLFIKVCPEVDAGLQIPRLPAEIQGGNGEDVLNGTCRVRNTAQEDVTEAFIKGAYKALEVARENGVRLAILKEKSPSCGSTMIYDGAFSGHKISGKGVTGALFAKNGIAVFSENEVRKAYEYWKHLQLQI